MTVTGDSIDLPLTASPDPVAVLRSILLARLAATGQTVVPVVANVREAGGQVPFYVLSEAGALRARGPGAYGPARVGLAAWAATEDAAAAAYRLASDLLHRQGPLVVDGAGVWKVFDETGLQRPLPDPDSDWWSAQGVFDLVMTDRAIGS